MVYIVEKMPDVKKQEEYSFSQYPKRSAVSFISFISFRPIFREIITRHPLSLPGHFNLFDSKPPHIH